MNKKISLTSLTQILHVMIFYIITHTMYWMCARYKNSFQINKMYQITSTDSYSDKQLFIVIPLDNKINKEILHMTLFSSARGSFGIG